LRGELATEIDIYIKIDIEIDIEIEKILEPIAWAFFNPYSRCPSTSFLLPLAKANGNKKGCSLPSGLN